MEEPPTLPQKTGRSWPLGVWWVLAVLVVLLLTGAAFALYPYYQVRAVLHRHQQLAAAGPAGPAPPGGLPVFTGNSEKIIAELGGPEAAGRMLELYMRGPDRLFPHKVTAAAVVRGSSASSGGWAAPTRRWWPSARPGRAAQEVRSSATSRASRAACWARCFTP
ncbi:MAG: hypothetical protein ACYTGB_11185 [Planctomycetota bacterium]